MMNQTPLPAGHIVHPDGQITRFLLTGEDDCYEESVTRSLFASQVITHPDFGQFQSRQDERTFYQTAWDGGAEWEGPLFSARTETAYTYARNMDGSLSPGRLFPSNELTSFSDPEGIIGTVDGQSIIWPTMNGNTLQFKRRTGSSGSANNVGAATSITGLGGVRDVTSDGETMWWLFATRLIGLPLNATDSTVLEVYPDVTTPLGPPNTETAGVGSNVLIATDGKILIYTGNRFWWLADKANADISKRVQIFDSDGLGVDLLAQATNPIITAQETRLAVSVPQGIYYAKNVAQGGLPQTFVYRLNRQSNGDFLRQPVAALPRGNIVTSIHWHMQSLLLMATGDYDQLLQSTAEKFRTDLWAVTPSLVTRVIGSIDRSDNPVDLCPWLLGSDGSNVYMGGFNSVWRYDAKSSAIEQIHLDSSVFNSKYVSQFLRWKNEGRMFGNPTNWGYSPNEVANSDLKIAAPTSQGYYHYDLVSLPFDFDLPHEMKHITSVSLETDDIDEDDVEIKVWVDRLDNDWTEILSHSSGSYKSQVVENPVSGRRFRYRLTYEVKAQPTTGSPARNWRPGIKGVMIKATAGELTRRIRAKIKPETMNVENQIVTGEQVLAQWTRLAELSKPVTVVLRFGDRWQSETKERVMRFDQVQITQKDPDKAETIVVLLTEVGGY